MSWMIKGICNLRDLFSDEGIDGWVVIILSGDYVKISHDGKEFKFKLTIKLSGVWI